ALRDVAKKYEKEWLHKWIHNSAAMVASGDERAVKIFNEFNGSPMQAFPQLSEADIDNILAYTSQPKAEPVVSADGGGGGATTNGGGFSNQMVLGLLAVVLLMLVIMLFLVNRVLKKIALANGVEYPEEEKRLPL